MKGLTGSPSTSTSNKTSLKIAQSYCFSFVTLIKYFKFKITVADINLAIKNKCHMEGHETLFHSTEKKRLQIMRKTRPRR
jgi:hypothetical protein